MRSRMILLMAAALIAGGCADSPKPLTAPNTPGARPRFAIFPQWVAEAQDIDNQVIDSVITPNVTRSNSYTHNVANPRRVWTALFYPATRTVDDTIFTDSLIRWDWYAGQTHHTCVVNSCGLNGAADSLVLYYHIRAVAPVSVGTPAGPDSIFLAKTYTWTVSATGGDAETGFSYQWQYSEDQGATWTNLPGSSSSYSRSIASPQNSFSLRVTATSGGRSATSARFDVWVRDTLEAPIQPVINGPDEIFDTGSYTWDSNGTTGGVPPYTYVWQYCQATCSTVGSSSSYTRSIDTSTDKSFTLKLTVSESTGLLQRDTTSLSVLVHQNGGPLNPVP